MGKQVGEAVLFHVAFQGPRVMNLQPTSTITSTITSKVALRVAIPVILKGEIPHRSMQEHAREVYYDMKQAWK